MWFKIIRLAEVEFTTREYDFKGCRPPGHY